MKTYLTSKRQEEELQFWTPIKGMNSMITFHEVWMIHIQPINHHVLISRLDRPYSRILCRAMSLRRRIHISNMAIVMLPQ